MSTCFAGSVENAAVVAGFLPARFDGSLPFLGTAVPAWLTPLSATLVHGGLVHLMFNLVVLVFCGVQVERVVGHGGVPVSAPVAQLMARAW